MIAALPMYDRPELAAATDRYWQAIASRLGCPDIPLTRGGDLWALWQSPDLLLAQTCGLPYRARLHDHVTLVGTPDYGLPGLDPGYYQSVLVVRRDDPATILADLANRPVAVNDPLSQSGWAALAETMANTPLGPVQLTGAHRASAQAVAEGTADLAAIDAVTWALIDRHDAFAQNLRVLTRTTPTPGLPYITAKGRDPEPLRAAITAAITDLDPADRSALMLRGLTLIPATQYLALPLPPKPAELP
ncbi:MAG: PhnD/SsuA/transferrin family substrate-binding protein [Paracoccaceae bacterium]|nr:PhnD/SsuA/transferrin family substrate-binding protein [Paracoccaceae bacterium]